MTDQGGNHPGAQLRDQLELINSWLGLGRSPSDESVGRLFDMVWDAIQRLPEGAEGKKIAKNSVKKWFRGEVDQIHAKSFAVLGCALEAVADDLGDPGKKFNQAWLNLSIDELKKTLARGENFNAGAKPADVTSRSPVVTYPFVLAKGFLDQFERDYGGVYFTYRLHSDHAKMCREVFLVKRGFAGENMLFTGALVTKGPIFVGHIIPTAQRFTAIMTSGNGEEPVTTDVLMIRRHEQLLRVNGGIRIKYSDFTNSTTAYRVILLPVKALSIADREFEGFRPLVRDFWADDASRGEDQRPNSAELAVFKRINEVLRAPHGSKRKSGRGATYESDALMSIESHEVNRLLEDFDDTIGLEAFLNSNPSQLEKSASSG